MQQQSTRSLRFQVPVPLPRAAVVGRKFDYSFCTPRPRGACASRSSTNPSGGPGGDYRFEARASLPAGLRLDPLSGLLLGIVRRNVKPGAHRFSVCVTTTAQPVSGKRPEVCLNTSVLVVADFSGVWDGTFSADEGQSSCASSARGNATLTLRQQGASLSGRFAYRVTSSAPNPGAAPSCVQLPAAGTIPLTAMVSRNTLKGSGFSLTRSGSTLSGTFFGMVQGIELAAEISAARLSG